MFLRFLSIPPSALEANETQKAVANTMRQKSPCSVMGTNAVWSACQSNCRDPAWPFLVQRSLAQFEPHSRFSHFCYDPDLEFCSQGTNHANQGRKIVPRDVKAAKDIAVGFLFLFV